MGFVNIHGQPMDMKAFREAQLEQHLRTHGTMVPKGRKPTVKRGYAAQPGTGPEGMTCKQCKHKQSFGGPNGHSAKTFIKCELRRDTWTHGPGTDILAGSPACSKFEPKV